MRQITPADLNKAKAYADKMCKLRQDVIDKAKAFRAMKSLNSTYNLCKSADTLEKFEAKYLKGRKP